MSTTTTSHRQFSDPSSELRLPDPAPASRLSRHRRTESRTAHDEFSVVAGRPGDHLAAHRLLTHLFQSPSAAEFQIQLEDPFYEPSDRLLVKRNSQLIGHSLLTKREMYFRERRLPCGSINDLGILPEYRARGCGSQLLAAAEQKMAHDGTAFGFLRTASPGFFQKHGWVVCFRHSYSVAGARDILSHLLERPRPARTPLSAAAPPLSIRVWRHVEQAGLMRLYDEYVRHACGPLVRDDKVWRWLLSRRAFDRIYIAVNSAEKLELDDAMRPIVGYAVIRKARIIELATSPGFPQAGEQLLAHACGDAIEHDDTYIRFDAPPHDPLHAVLEASGGERVYHEAEGGEVLMLKVFDLPRLLGSLCDLWQQRMVAADRPLPCELGLLLDGQKYCLMLEPDDLQGAVEPTATGRITAGRLGRSYIECGTAELTQLLFGHLELEKALATGRIHASTRIAYETAATLFPPVPAWRPTLDGLQL